RLCGLDVFTDETQREQWGTGFERVAGPGKYMRDHSDNRRGHAPVAHAWLVHNHSRNRDGAPIIFETQWLHLQAQVGARLRRKRDAILCMRMGMLVRMFRGRPLAVTTQPGTPGVRSEENHCTESANGNDRTGPFPESRAHILNSPASSNCSLAKPRERYLSH